VTSNNWSVHDLIFVDSPEFHFVIDRSNRGEVYNLAIRGANIGGSDGIDVTGTNVWVHDVMVIRTCPYFEAFLTFLCVPGHKPR
jgi:rhamnogalacturonan hydrolase